MLILLSGLLVMIHTEKHSIGFYQALGKLFYAIAAADKHVLEEEYNALKKILETEWVVIDEFKDDNNSNGLKQIQIVFDWLNKKQELKPNQYLKDFLEFKNNNENLFTKNIKYLISKTAHAIANSYSRKNKSELIILAKLDLELKK